MVPKNGPFQKAALKKKKETALPGTSQATDQRRDDG